MSKRKPIGKQILGGLAAARQQVEAKGTSKRGRWTSLRVSPEVAERLRDAAHWSRETVIAITERALLAEVDRMERERGEFFAARPK